MKGKYEKKTVPKKQKRGIGQERKKGRSTQELLGIKGFTQYGLLTGKGELLFFNVVPTNISVLSYANIETKLRHLMMVLSSIPDIELVCLDSSECFDQNMAYLKGRLEEEQNARLCGLLEQDMRFLDQMQVEMATARQFMFVARLKGLKERQTFEAANRVEKTLSEQGFEVRRLKKPDIKRFLAIYFEASMNGEHMPDIDGEQFFETDQEGGE